MKIIAERNAPPEYPPLKITAEMSDETSTGDILDILVTLARGMGYQIDRELLLDWVDSSFPKEEA